MYCSQLRIFLFYANNTFRPHSGAGRAKGPNTGAFSAPRLSDSFSVSSAGLTNPYGSFCYALCRALARGRDGTSLSELKNEKHGNESKQPLLSDRGTHTASTFYNGIGRVAFRPFPARETGHNPDVRHGKRPLPR